MDNGGLQWIDKCVILVINYTKSIEISNKINFLYKTEHNKSSIRYRWLFSSDEAQK